MTIEPLADNYIGHRGIYLLSHSVGLPLNSSEQAAAAGFSAAAEPSAAARWAFQRQR